MLDRELSTALDLGREGRPSEGMKPPTGATPLIAIAAVAIDTETTGLDATKARVVQIGAIGIARGKVVREIQFDLLVDPGEAIPSAASLVHGITDADVGGAASFPDAWARFQEFVRGPHPRRPLDRLRPGGVGSANADAPVCPGTSLGRCASGFLQA